MAEDVRDRPAGHAGRDGRGLVSAQNTGSADGENPLARQLSDLARALQHRQPQPDDVLQQVADSAVEIIPGVEHASITLVRRLRDVRSAAASDEVGRRLDALQDEVQQGPCLDSAYEHLTVRVDDLAAEERWPALAARAGDLGMASVLCLQLYVVGDDLGALNLCAREPGAFDDESEHVGLFFAAHAAVAVASAQKVTGLSAALAHRDLIGQAKGVLMATYKVSADDAFAMLSKLSQDTNRKLVDVADAVTTAGDLH